MCCLCLCAQQIRSFTNNLWCIFGIRVLFCFRSLFFVCILFFGRYAQTVGQRHLEYTRQWSRCRALLCHTYIYVCVRIQSVCHWCRHLSKTECCVQHAYISLLASFVYGISRAATENGKLTASANESVVGFTLSLSHTAHSPQSTPQKKHIFLMNPCSVSRLRMYFFVSCNDLYFILTFHYLLWICICISSNAANKHFI